MTRTRDDTRIDALTGVRMLAAAGVFLSHAPSPEYLPITMRTFMTAGYNGVTLFFVLSGFVLAWNYVDRMAAPSARAMRTFFVARLARVYPLYLLALVIEISPLLVGGQPLPGLLRHALAIQTWSPNISVAFGYNAPGWSIGVEFFLYACFPLVIVLLGRLRRSPRALMVVAALCVVAMLGLALWFELTGRADIPAALPGSAHRWLYRTPVTRLGDFVVGAVTALLVTAAQKRPRVALGAQVAGATGMLALMCWRPLLLSAWSWDVAYVLPAAVLIFGLTAHPRTVLARLLATRPMVVLGEASFAFYLLQRPTLDRWGYASVDTWRGWAFTTAIQFLVLVFIAIGAHVAFEVPLQRWIRTTFDRRRARVVDAGTIGRTSPHIPQKAIV